MLQYLLKQIIRNFVKTDIQQIEKQVPKVDAEVKAEQIPLGTPVPVKLQERIHYVRIDFTEDELEDIYLVLYFLWCFGYTSDL